MSYRLNRFFIVFSLMGFVTTGCGEKEQIQAKSTQGVQTQGIQAQDQSQEQFQDHGLLISGKAISTMNSGGYTYIEIETGKGEKIWAAGPETVVKNEDTIELPSSSIMNNFHSNSLDRTFEAIHFVSYFVINGNKSGTPSGYSAGSGQPKDSQLSNGGQVSASHGSSAPETIQTVEAGTITKAEGGYTVDELNKDRESLKGKIVSIRGKVLKFNSGILGKNWVHLADGTGEKGKDDVTLTTQETVKVGDTVLAKGLVALDKDFGAGYVYPLILEEASFTAE